MSNINPQQPNQPPAAPPVLGLEHTRNTGPGKPDRPKRFGWPTLIITAVLALGVGGLIGGSGDTPPPGAAPIATASATEGAGEPTSESAEEPTEEPAQEGYIPKKSDWTLKLKTTDKQCFGSVGCNVTVRVSPEYSGSGTVASLPNSGTIDITYKLSGDESGPIVGTATVQLADETVQDQEESLSTRSSGTKVAASVTDVEYNEWG